jgi:hypothetical protein
MFKSIIARLREPSTMAGLAGLSVLFGHSVEAVQVYANGAAAILGVLAVALPEKSSATPAQSAPVAPYKTE